MNIASIIGVATPAGITGNAVTPPDAFGALIAIGGDGPPVAPAQPAVQATVAPAIAAVADVRTMPEMVTTLVTAPVKTGEPAVQTDALSVPVPVEEHAAILSASPPPAAAEETAPQPVAEPPQSVPNSPVMMAAAQIAVPDVPAVLAPQLADDEDDAPVLEAPSGDQPSEPPVLLVTTTTNAPVAIPVKPGADLPLADVPSLPREAQAAVPKAAIGGAADLAPQDSIALQADPVEASPHTLPGITTARAQSFNEIYGHQRVAAHTADPVVSAQPGRIGREMGVAIARHVAAGRDEVMVRLDPPEMGRVDIRLSFDRDGMVRGVIAADSPNALDMLRKETGDLNRALADAGVRADAQAFRFDSRGRDPGQPGHQGRQAGAGQEPMFEGEAAPEAPLYRALRASGRVDLMA